MLRVMGVQRKATNVTWHSGDVTRADRAKIHGHEGVTLWLTGLSASGKSTIARRAEWLLAERGHFAYVLDGDNIRHGLNKNLGFSPADRTENIRRIGEVAKLFTDAGAITLAAFISPYRADRAEVRALFAPGDFVEIFVHTPVEVCEQRDPKGLYKKARAGDLAEFTGVSAPYEAPEKPELVLESGTLGADACAARIVAYLEDRGVIPRK